jgi:hypothetical protein
VVQVDLRGAGGTSHARSPEGNYYYCARRDTPSGQLLLGRMFGEGYHSHLKDGYLEFEVTLHRSAKDTVAMHFRAQDHDLVNLTAPPRPMLIARQAPQPATPADPQLRPTQGRCCPLLTWGFAAAVTAAAASPPRAHHVL